jgi:hypothetical protein
MELTAENICYSGGAAGADLAWGAAAARRGDRVIHFSFAGHRTAAPRDTRRVLSDAELRAADPHLARAARELHRPWPPESAYARALLQRDWYQVKDSAALYAIGNFRRDGQITGGTAWTVAMFLGRERSEMSDAFLFDQEAGHWLVWRGEWQLESEPPAPRGRWTGIGTRALNPAGAAAIATLLGR